MSLNYVISPIVIIFVSLKLKLSNHRVLADMILKYKALHNRINCLSAAFSDVTMSSILCRKSIRAQECGAVDTKPATLFSHKALSM